MADPSTGHGSPHAAMDDTSTQPAAQNQLVADELPMSEDDISLAFRSSRIMLQQLNDRRQAPPHRRLPPRHRYQDSGRPADRLAPWSNHRDLKHRDSRTYSRSPLRSCMKARCSPPIEPGSSTPCEQKHREGDSDEEMQDRDTLEAHAEAGLSRPTSPTRFETLMTARTHCTLGTPTNTIPMLETNPPGHPTKPTKTAPTSMFIEVDSNQGGEEDEGFFDGPDDLVQSGKGTNDTPDSVGALRRQALLRFRRSGELASSCPVVVRSVPRMRRRKPKKIEVRHAAKSRADSGTPSHANGTNGAPG